MPLWAWSFLVLMLSYNTFVLWRACSQKRFKYGPIIYSLDDGPAYFWFFAFVFTASEIFLVGLFSVVAASTVWGPIFHQ